MQIVPINRWLHPQMNEVNKYVHLIYISLLLSRFIIQSTTVCVIKIALFQIIITINKLLQIEKFWKNIFLSYAAKISWNKIEKKYIFAAWFLLTDTENMFGTQHINIEGAVLIIIITSVPVPWKITAPSWSKMISSLLKFTYLNLLNSYSSSV